ncbi:hypothetical protein JVX98_13450 [Ensifer sp. PDNC004]|uniref:hypothetical protein n=1 Tax=Ensifer sp. PDNC004 TaxID=2811423 RepID=UPI001966A095|nr:hypothetical protein [Ensifer sp. PDNC004]QRY69221.1 hypothetical protein JVX98_13450 [Ensifer sp. PDNC004]
MNDRPILFSAPMVQALLAGRKTQTRRKVTPHIEVDHIGHLHSSIKLRISVGDRLYVREHWRTTYGLDWTVEDLGRPLRPVEFDPKTTPIEYLADGENELGGKDRRAMHMPRWASRLTLTVTDVRVERLQSISEADALAEGLAGVELDGMDPRGWYRNLWESINGPGSWEANPWVAAYTFRVIKQNIDQIERAAA